MLSCGARSGSGDWRKGTVEMMGLDTCAGTRSQRAFDVLPRDLGFIPEASVP